MRDLVRLCRILLVMACVPKAYGQWKQTNGPTGLDVHLVVQDSALVSYTNWGIYRSKDHGTSWDSLPNPPIHSFPPNFLVHRGEVYVHADSEIVRYDEKRMAWVAVNPPQSGGHFSRAAAYGPHLYVSGDSGGIWETADNGQHWTSVHASTSTSTIFILSADSLGISAVTNEGFIRSSDNGAHWKSGPLPVTPSKVFFLVSKGANVFISAGDTLLRSSDSGLTWKANLTQEGSRWFSGLSRVRNFLFVARVDSLLNMTLLRSGDDGASWQEVSRYFNERQGVQIQSFIGLGGDLVAATFTGMYRSSDNGATWSPQNKGSSLSNFKSLVTLPNGHWVGLTVRGLFETRDAGENWALIEDSTLGYSSNEFKFLYGAGSFLYAYGEGIGFFRSADLGRNWSALTPSFAVADERCIKSLGSDLFIISDDEGVWKSSDHGATWVQRNAGLPQNSLMGLAVCHGALFGIVDSSAYRYQPSTGGWDRIASLPKSASNEGFFSDGASLYLSGWSGPSYRSADDGLTWKKLDGILDSATLTCAATYGNAIFVGAKPHPDVPARVAFSKDQGADWSVFGEGLPYSDMLSLRIEGDYLLATTSRGLYKRPLSDIPGLDIQSVTGPRASRPDPIRAKLVDGKLVWMIPGNAILGPLKVDTQGKRLP